MPCWNTELRLVLQMMTSAHCTTTMLTKNAVWQVNSTILRCSYVCTERGDGKMAGAYEILFHELQKNPLEMKPFLPIAARSCPLGRWRNGHPSWAGCPQAQMARNRFRPWWQNRWKTHREPGSYLQNEPQKWGWFGEINRILSDSLGIGLRSSFCSDSGRAFLGSTGSISPIHGYV